MLEHKMYLTTWGQYRAGGQWYCEGKGQESRLTLHSFFFAFPFPLKLQGDAGREVSPPLPACVLKWRSLYHTNLWFSSSSLNQSNPYITAAYSSFWDLEALVSVSAGTANWLAYLARTPGGRISKCHELC